MILSWFTSHEETEVLESVLWGFGQAVLKHGQEWRGWLLTQDVVIIDLHNSQVNRFMFMVWSKMGILLYVLLCCLSSWTNPDVESQPSITMLDL